MGSQTFNEDDDIGIGKKLKPKNNAYISILSNVLWVLGAVALVVGSFWLSFMIGRRILVGSVQNISRPKEIVTQKVNLKVQKKIVLPAVPAKVKEKVFPQKADVEKLFRVQIAKFYKKDEAISLMKSLQDKNFDVFAKNLDNGNWIVQIGAFKDKSKALRVIRDLKSKGVQNKVVIKEEN